VAHLVPTGPEPRLPKIADEDLVALRLCLTSLNGEIADALRRADREKLAEYDPHIRLATHGLFQLPAFRGPVYRGAQLPDDVAERYVPGDVVRERSFLSASADPTREFHGNVQFVIESVTGRSVGALADDPEEREIVFLTATRFKVLAVEVDGTTGVRTVYLAELPDPAIGGSAS